MIDYKIIDNLIPTPYQNELEDILDSQTFPWYFSTNISYNHKNKPYEDPFITNAPGLGHLAFDPETGLENSFIFSKVKPILYFFQDKEKIQIEKIKRVRLRRTTPYPGHTLKHYTPPHVDLHTSEEYYSLVYYVDETDGDTVLFNNKFEDVNEVVLYDKSEPIARISPKKGRGLFFKGKIFHSGNCPVNYDKRTIINFDFTIK
jgi:hypothetical protein